MSLVRRPGDAPAEAALYRSDVGDAVDAVVAHLLLPARKPLEHRVEDASHPDDRVFTEAPRAERRMDERPACLETHPDRPEVREDDLVLGRLAEEAHVGHASVRHEVARAGRVAAVLRTLRIALLCLLDLSRDSRD